MNMKYKSNPIMEVMTIESFAEKHDLTLVISNNTETRVSFEHVELKQGSGLLSIYGKGDTVEEALKDLAKQISSQLLVYDAYNHNGGRRELHCPIITSQVTECDLLKILIEQLKEELRISKNAVAHLLLNKH